MAAGVFISFRPEDSAWAARIRASLQSRAEHDELGRGVDFANALKTRATELEAVVMIVGRTWLAGMLDDPSDPVRIEIEAALNRKIHVIPVLVDGASMPAAAALPESLKVLAHLRPIDAVSGRFDSQMGRLEEALTNRTVRGININSSTITANQIAGTIINLRELSHLIESAKEKPTKEERATGIIRRIVQKKRAGKKFAANKSAAKVSVARKTAPKKQAPKKAAKPTPPERGDGDNFSTIANSTIINRSTVQNALNSLKSNAIAGEISQALDKASAAAAESNRAGSRPRVTVNQDLSVHEMIHLALARGDEARRDANSRRECAKDTQPAEAIDEIVECSVFGPPAALAGKTILIQVFLNLADQAERARFLATTMDGSAKLKGAKPLDLPIKRGARVEVSFSAIGLAVDEPVQSVVWQGQPTFCQFMTTIPAGTSGQSFFPIVRVSVDGKLVGRIAFSLSSDDAASQPTSEPLGDHAKLYKYAFVSYASKDREEVLKRVQMLEVLKTKFFQDILSLDPGDRWEKKLYENIDRCDLFLLFWSQAAKDSQWVLKEAEYALAHQQKSKGSEPDLVPVVLEQHVSPPPSLSAFHFNDKISYLVSLMPTA